MLDKVDIRIGKYLFEDVEDYSIEADLYTPSDAFKFTMYDADRIIKKGSIIQMLVNGDVELYGIVGHIERATGKTGSRTVVSGRDMMGYLLDSNCEDLTAYENISCIDLAKILCSQLKLIKRSPVIYQDGCQQFDTPHEKLQIEAGMSVFDAISKYATMRGLLFYALPDGTLVFGKKRSSGKVQYSIENRAIGVNNNTAGGTVIEDIEKGYSKITVICQTADVWSTETSEKYSFEDASYPYYKPLVITVSGDRSTAEAVAKAKIEQMRADAYVLKYTVVGHSQNGKNWKINKLCHITDDGEGIDGDYVVTGRTFTGSKAGGKQTLVKLGRR